MRSRMIGLALSVCSAMVGVGCEGASELDAPVEDVGSAAAPLRAHERYRRDVLTTGADIHATNGLQFGSDGLLYVASDLERAIVAIDPRSGRRVHTFGPPLGVETPDDLTFGPDGSLYWTALLTGEVARLTPGGVKQTIAHLGPGVNPIAFSPDGRLFVGRIFLADELYELDPNGIVPPRLVGSGFGGVNAMQFGADGRLYAPLWFRGEVVRIDPDTGASTVLASGLGTPAAAKFDASGNLHVVDQAGGRLVRVDVTTGAQTVVATGIEGVDSVAFDVRGNAFVSNSHDGSILELDRRGNRRTVLRGGVAAPGGLALLSERGRESLFVADALSIKVVDPRRGGVRDEIQSIIGVTPLVTPFTAQADGDRLVVSSWFARAVQVFDARTRTVVETHTDFSVPIDALRVGGDLVVSELGTGSVTAKHPDGTKSSLATGLATPTGLAAAGGKLYVGDWAGGRILQLVDGGSPLATPRLVATGLSRPEGLAVDDDGTLLVVETGTRLLTRVDPVRGRTSVVARDLEVGLPAASGGPPSFLFSGVTVGRDGTIYVSYDVTNRIVAFRPSGHGPRR